MKKFLTTMAVLTVVATPAFAQYNPRGNIGQITHPADAYYHHNFHHNAASARHRDAASAYARAVPETFASPQSSVGVYDAQGNLIGADPDPNVRMRLQMDHRRN